MCTCLSVRVSAGCIYFFSAHAPYPPELTLFSSAYVYIPPLWLNLASYFLLLITTKLLAMRNVNLTNLKIFPMPKKISLVTLKTFLPERKNLLNVKDINMWNRYLDYVLFFSHLWGHITPSPNPYALLKCITSNWSHTPCLWWPEPGVVLKKQEV